MTYFPINTIFLEALKNVLRYDKKIYLDPTSIRISNTVVVSHKLSKSNCYDLQTKK